MILELDINEKVCVIVLGICILLEVVVIAWLNMIRIMKNQEIKSIECKTKATENPFAIKYELGQVVYVFKDNRIYKDQIREIKINKNEITYTGIILKNINEKCVYATFDDLCIDNKLNKDDILMYAYNNDIDKRK